MKFLFALLLISLCTVQVARAQAACTICEFVVGEVEKYLQSNATDYEILEELAKACDLLTDPSWVTACKDFVEKEGPTLIAHIVAQEPPATVCSYVDLCNSSSTIQKAVAAPTIKSGDDALCGICVFLVGDVESYLSDNTTESDILGFLESDCSILGIKSWVATCQGIVATFGPEIIKLVIDKQPADVVCNEVGLCNSSSVAKAAATHKISIPAAIPTEVNGTLVCEVCEMLVNFTERLVANNKTETEIIDGLEVVCNLIPLKSISQECDSMVDEFGTTIIAYLMNEEPPAVVCTEIGLCTTKSHPKECFAPGKC